MEKNLRLVYFFSWIILVIVIVSLFSGGYPLLYSDSTAKSTVALSILDYLLIPYIIVLILAMRGSLRAQFILFSFFVFLLYYSFANIMGLTHHSIIGFSLIKVISLNGSIILLILICLNRVFRSMDFNAVKERFTSKTPRVQTTVFLLFASFIFTFNFFYRLINWLPVYELTRLLCIMSLEIVSIMTLIPIYLTTSVLLFKKRPLGYFLAPIFLPICAFKSINLSGLFGSNTIFIIFVFIALILEILFLKNIKKIDKKTEKQER